MKNVKQLALPPPKKKEKKKGGINMFQQVSNLSDKSLWIFFIERNHTENFLVWETGWSIL